MPLRYSPDADAQLDALEAAGDSELWNSICDAIDLIADRPDSKQVRREAIRTPEGNTVWRVPVRNKSIDDFYVLWSARHDIEYIVYVGVMRASRPT